MRVLHRLGVSPLSICPSSLTVNKSQGNPGDEKHPVFRAAIFLFEASFHVTHDRLSESETTGQVYTRLSTLECESYLVLYYFVLSYRWCHTCFHLNWHFPFCLSCQWTLNSLSYFCKSVRTFSLRVQTEVIKGAVLQSAQLEKFSLNFWSSSFVINNYWMRLNMISWIIKPEVCVICRSRRLRQITQTRGFDYSWYHKKNEFNNCFNIHFSHN